MWKTIKNYLAINCYNVASVLYTFSNDSIVEGEQTFIFGQEMEETTIVEISKFFKNLLFFSYRKINSSSNNDHDIGWGCTIRNVQTMLSNILCRQLTNDHLKSVDNAIKLKVLEMFNDKEDGIFSFNTICDYLCHMYNYEKGNKVGPTNVCHALKDILKYKKDITSLNLPLIHIFMDGNVDLLELNKDKERSKIAIIPLRLGIQKMNPIYFEKLLAYFKLNSFCCMIGGYSSRSLLFIGIQENHKIIYMDPHEVRKDCESEQDIIQSYQCITPLVINIKNIDATCVLVFYMHDDYKVNQFIEDCSKINSEWSNDVHTFQLVN